MSGLKNTVFFLQGRGTFFEFYEILVLPLLEGGLDVWMYDLSGQGGSTRLLSYDKHCDEETVRCLQHIDNFDLYVEDAFAFIDEVILPHAEGKLFLGGYSTGGHIALRCLQLRPAIPFEAAFIISPLLSLNTFIPNSLMSYILWATSYSIDLEVYLPGAGPEDPVFIMPYEGNPYTRDEANFHEIQNLCDQNRSRVMGGISVGWLKAVTDSLGCLWSNKALNAIEIPVLIGTGGEDGVVDISYNEYFTNKLKKSKHLFYPNGRHELFRETEGIQSTLWMDFDDFFSKINEEESANSLLSFLF